MIEIQQKILHFKKPEDCAIHIEKNYLLHTGKDCDRVAIDCLEVLILTLTPNASHAFRARVKTLVKKYLRETNTPSFYKKLCTTHLSYTNSPFGNLNIHPLVIQKQRQNSKNGKTTRVESFWHWRCTWPESIIKD